MLYREQRSSVVTCLFLRLQREQPLHSFNNAIRTADAIGASKTPRTVQRLEQSLIDWIDPNPVEWSPTSLKYRDYLQNIPLTDEKGVPTPEHSNSPYAEEWLNWLELTPVFSNIEDSNTP